MEQDPTPVTAEIVNTTTICSTFPRFHSPQVNRDNFIHAFEEILGGEVDVLLVQGKEEIGKTTVLAQFARRHPDRCLSVFVRSSNRFSFDPAIVLSDLCNQAHWLLFRRECPDQPPADESELRRLLFELQRRARRTAGSFYFVFDGLAGLDQDASQFRQLVLSLLPIGSPGFKFLITGAETMLGGSLKGVPWKTFTLPGLTLDETAAYLQDFGLSSSAVNELFRTFRGVPGRLASVRRLLESGADAGALLDTPGCQTCSS